MDLYSMFQQFRLKENEDADASDSNAHLGLRSLCSESLVEGKVVPITTYHCGPTQPDVTVVFIHGFTLAAESFFLQIESLRSHYPEVGSLLFDLRGHGKTGEVAPEQCTVEGATDDVLEIIGRCAPTGRLILVGHSLGGMIALSVLRRATDELFGRIAGMVLIATSIEALSSQGIPQVLASPIAKQAYELMERSPEVISKFRKDVADLLAPTLAATVFKSDATSYDLVKFHASMIHETPLSTFAGYFNDLQKHDELGAAPRLQSMPGFVIVGEDDHVTPLSQSEQILTHWPKAQLVCSEKCGHMLILESPGAVNKALSELLDAIE